MELEPLLEKLRMEHLGAQLDSICEQAAKRELGYREFLLDALNAEWQGRHLKGVESRLGRDPVAISAFAQQAFEFLFVHEGTSVPPTP